jgi:hypothetical protein
VQTIDGIIALYFDKVDGKLRLKKGYASGWQKGLPKGSRWFPGCPGDPACEGCDGTGYLRLDFPVGHPALGKLVLCECAAGRRKK